MSNLSPFIQGTRSLVQQVRAIAGLAAPPKTSPFTHPGLQRNYPPLARSDVEQGLKIGSTPPGTYHPSPMVSPRCQSPEQNLATQWTDKTTTSLQDPQSTSGDGSPTYQLHRCPLIHGSLSGDHAHSVADGRNRDQSSVSLASVAETSMRAPGVNKAAGAIRGLYLTQRQLMALRIETSIDIQPSQALTAYRIPSQIVMAGAAPHTADLCDPPASLASLTSDDCAGQTTATSQAAVVSEPIPSTSNTGEANQIPPEATPEAAEEEKLLPELLKVHDQLFDVASLSGADVMKRTAEQGEREKERVEGEGSTSTDGQVGVEPNP